MDEDKKQQNGTEIIKSSKSETDITDDSSFENEHKSNINDTISSSENKTDTSMELEQSNYEFTQFKGFTVIDDVDKKIVESFGNFSTSTTCRNVSNQMSQTEDSIKTNDSSILQLDTSSLPSINLDETVKQDVTGDKNVEADSLIITADDTELENEIVDVKENNGENKKTNLEEAVNESVNVNNNEVSTSEAKKLDETDNKMVIKQNKVVTDCVNKSMTRSVWVSNINHMIKATDLKKHFAKFGKVVTAKIVTDGKRCFGYLNLVKSDDVENCIKYLDNTYFEGKKITVSTMKPEKEVENSDIKQLSKSSECVEKRSKSESKVDQKIKKRCKKDDPLTTVFPTNQAEKRLNKTPAVQCNHEKLQKENERIKRRLHEEEHRLREERRRQKMKEEIQREMDFKLKQERHKLKLERELFEKERQEAFRLNQERRKLEEEKLQIIRYKAKLEEELRELKKCKPDHIYKRSHSEDKQKAVKSKISDLHKLPASYSSEKRSSRHSRSRSKNKISQNHYKREEEKHYIHGPPPPPKLSSLERNAKHQYVEQHDHYGEEKKYFPEKNRKYDEYRTFSNKKSASDRRNAKTHRDGKTNVSGGDRFAVVTYEEVSCEPWKSTQCVQKSSDAWVESNHVEPWKMQGPNIPGVSVSGNRYPPESSFQFQSFGGTSRPTYWYPPPLSTDCSRYDHYSQPQVNRKY